MPKIEKSLVKRAELVYEKAVRKLGFDLGGYSPVDLFCDQMPDISVDQAKQLVIVLGIPYEKKPQRVFDVVSFVMDFESGELSDEEIIKGFQHLIDTALVWKLQGSYGRMADSLIRQGHCHRAGSQNPKVLFEHKGRYGSMFYEPTVIECELCGSEVDLRDELENICSGCGQGYNFGGQKIRPRSEWEEPIEPEDYY